jgi:hypothetical protein
LETLERQCHHVGQARRLTAGGCDAENAAECWNSRTLLVESTVQRANPLPDNPVARSSAPTHYLLRLKASQELHSNEDVIKTQSP